MRFILGLGVIALAVFTAHLVLAASPVISSVSISSVQATSTSITWTTDQKTDSFVDFSQDTNYCGVRNAGDFSTAHTLVIPNLDPVTTYFFRIRATDSLGDQSFSGDYTFTTTSTADTSKLVSITDAQQKLLAEKAISTINQITNPQALQAVGAALSSQVQANVGPPQILGSPTLDIGSDQVTVTWNTDQDSNGAVSIETDSAYSQNSGNPYARQEVDTNADSKVHTVVIPGLIPATLYHYKVSSQAPVGSAGESGDLTFTTKAVLPQIINPHIVKVGEHEATISWGTPLPSAGTVTYTNMATRKALSVGDPALLATHIVQLTNLVYQTRYSAVVAAQNQAGDTVTSQPIYFVTTKNIYPPVISQVNNDSTLYPGQDTTVQTVISWQTDIPASCNLSYISGVVKNAADVVSSTPETAFLVKHVDVVTSFSPATVYKYWVTCTDVDGNTTSSEDFVLLTPVQEKSIVDLILSNFQGTFGWLGGGKKK